MSNQTTTVTADAQDRISSLSLAERCALKFSDFVGGLAANWSYWPHEYAAGEVVDVEAGTYIIEEVREQPGRFPDHIDLRRVAGDGLVHRKMTERVLNEHTGRGEEEGDR